MGLLVVAKWRIQQLFQVFYVLPKLEDISFSSNIDLLPLH